MAKPESGFAALHAWLVEALGLIPEPAHGGSWRCYFVGAVEWHPARSTRLIKVLRDHAGMPFKVQLCVSSDNNNSVFIDAPFERALLAATIAEEAERLTERLNRPVVPAQART
jgi:hypothetical protein